MSSVASEGMNHFFSDVANLGEYVLNPSTVFSQNFKANALGLASPVFDVLTEEAHLRGDAGNTKCRHNVVITISSHFVTYDLIGIAHHHTFWEMCVLLYVLEDGKVAWVSRLNIVRLSSVIWPDKLVAGCMAVDNEFEIACVG